MNEKIFFFFYNLAHQSAFLDKVIIFLADTFPYLVVLAAIIFMLFHHEVIPSKNPIQEFKKKWKEVVLVFFAAVLTWIVIAPLFKIIIGSPRPFLVFPIQPLIPETGFGFPSGHSTSFMALAYGIFLSHKKAGFLFILFALIIGLARIAAGVHFPLDILGGFVLGPIITYLVKTIYNKIFKKA